MATSGTRKQFSRSISLSFSSSLSIEDEEVSKAIHSGIEECWNDDLFFDAEIVTNDGSVKAHRIILASVCPFFKAAFSPQHQLNNETNCTSISLPTISTETMKLILQYIYTKKIKFTGEILEELVVAANFLQLASLEKKCAEIIFSDVSPANIKEMLQLAIGINLLSLQDCCKKYIGENFVLLTNSHVMHNFTIDEYDYILKNCNFMIKDAENFMPPPSIEERIIFVAIVKYLQSIDDKARAVKAASGLLSHVRFHLIMKYEFETLIEFINEKVNDENLADVCKKILVQSVDVESSKNNTELESMGKPLPRQYPSLMIEETNKIAHGYVQSDGTSFSDFSGNNKYVKGMKLWMRRWDGRQVLGAMEILYSDGKKSFHGEISHHEIYEFILEPDEFIVKVVAFSGYMIDNLEFITNKGNSYGPYGGDGGGRRYFDPPGYLSYISGSHANTQGALGIVSLSFHWVCYDLAETHPYSPPIEEDADFYQSQDSDNRSEDIEAYIDPDYYRWYHG